jgi:hypothetical protein
MSLFAYPVNFFPSRNLIKVARQILATALIVLLVTNHTFAASGIAGAAAEFGQELRLRWYAKGWDKTFGFSLFTQGGGSPRGWIDLNLGFNYNSRLWHKSGTDMYFDVDRDWVAGWILGFGKIVMAGTSYILMGGDGTRHSYSGLYRGSFDPPNSSLQSFEAYTTDGSFINYYAEGYKAEFDNSGGHNMVRAWAKLPNGTTIEYGAPANYAIYPTQIIDANGNFITITYRTYYRCWTGFCGNVQEGPNIETITDAIGRRISL